jgi:hypothetical protein
VANNKFADIGVFESFNSSGTLKTGMGLVVLFIMINRDNLRSVAEYDILITQYKTIGWI